MTIYDADINGGEADARCDVCGCLHGDNGHDHEADEINARAVKVLDEVAPYSPRALRRALLSVGITVDNPNKWRAIAEKWSKR